VSVDLKSLRSHVDASDRWPCPDLSIACTCYEGSCRVCEPVTTGEAVDLLTLAETMTAALLAIEWAAEFGGYVTCCPRCERDLTEEFRHRDDCSLDAALKLAGYPDQLTRDAERQRLAAR
jgi:hypothetical protein